MKRHYFTLEKIVGISLTAMGWAAIVWGVAWIIGYDRYVARPAFVIMGLGACLILIASFIEFCKECAGDL